MTAVCNCTLWVLASHVEMNHGATVVDLKYDAYGMVVAYKPGKEQITDVLMPGQSIGIYWLPVQVAGLLQMS
jgi:hypothetical protein